MKRPFTIRAAWLAAACLFAVVLAGNPIAARAADTAEVSTEYVIVNLQDAPAASYEGGLAGLARTKPLKGKLDINSPAVRAYLKHLDNVHANYQSWLRGKAPKAEIFRKYGLAANAVAIKLNGHRAEDAVTGPGSKKWSYSAIYHPTMNVSAPLIGADILWGVSPADAGKGLSVAVIDSGIQAGHPFFACKGANGIPAIIHHGPYYSGNAPGGKNPLPTIINTHGTHVAGTIGGCVSDLATIDPNGPIVGVISGIAPGVTLHDFNVFPGVGAGIVNHNGGAFSHDIAEAIDDAIAAGVDVINMSLGGGVQGPNDFLAEAADAAVDAGIVVVCSAGNGGPGDSTVGSPGTGRKVIATGATSNPHFIGIPVTVGSSTYGAMLGEFAGFGVVAAPYTVTDPANGCGALATDLTGKIGLIDRGACTFGTKALNAEIAGALGALIVNNRAGDPIPMAADPAAPATIPVAMLGRADGNAIKPAGTMSIDGATQAEFKTASADILADFSSRGPAPFTRIIKPDVMAPGVNVYSSVFNFGPGGFGDIVYDFELFEGTSMAAPHVAGSAVLLLEKHPGWSPADVRSALVNNGARVVTDTLTGATDPGLLARGGGRVDLVAANDTPLTINPANASFGFWAGNSAVSGVINLKVKNVSGSAKTCAVSVTGPSIVTASPASLNLAAGATGVVRVRLNAGTSSKTGSGDYEGDVVITCNGATLRAPWFARIDRKAKP